MCVVECVCSVHVHACVLYILCRYMQFEITSLRAK